ncbi:hypothetical protein GCM10022206_43360 [Streptomyces chiangmaiensis]
MPILLSGEVPGHLAPKPRTGSAEAFDPDAVHRLPGLDEQPGSVLRKCARAAHMGLPPAGRCLGHERRHLSSGGEMGRRLERDRCVRMQRVRARRCRPPTRPASIIAGA